MSTIVFFWKRRCSLLAFILTLAVDTLSLAAALWAQASPSGTAGCIPFEYNPRLGSGIVVQARLNGGPPLPYILDTGCDLPVIVEEWAARRNHLKLTKSQVTVGPDKQELSVAQDQTLLILGINVGNSVEASDVPLFVGQTHVGSVKAGPLAGVIGMPVLEVARLRFDFDAKKMYWSRPIQADTSGPAGPSLALQRSPDGARYFVACPPPSAVTAGPAGGPPRLLLDTGADTSTLPADVIASLRPRAAFLRIWSDITGDHPYVRWLVPDLEPFGFDTQNIEIASDPSREPALGMDVLSRFQPVLDFPARQLRLQPKAGRAVPSRRGFTGITLSQDAGKTTVGFVQAGSPAARAGLKNGMVVLSVDGRPITSLNPPMQGTLVDGNAGTTAGLLIGETGKKPRTIEVPRLNDDDSGTFLPVGVRLSPQAFPQGYGVIVEAILCSSTAYSSGLRAGDIIRSADGGGLLLTKTSGDAVNKLLPRVEALLQRPSLTLSVRHLGEKEVQTVTLSMAATLPAAPPATIISPAKS